MNDNLPPMPTRYSYELVPDADDLTPDREVDVFTAAQMREYALAARRADEALMREAMGALEMSLPATHRRTVEVMGAYSRTIAKLRARLTKPEGEEA